MAMPYIDPELNLQKAFSAIFNRILSTVKTAPHRFAVALSGGADSMALVLLLKSYVDTHGGYLATITVDHQLRAESATEAESVAAWMQTAGIEHHILKMHWDKKPTAHIQEQARQKRYQLLEDYCAEHKIDFLLTAHHADDVEETLMMRLWRGSGVEGLAGIPQIRETEKVTILRPLLAFRKAQLENYLRERSAPWIEDSSNHSDDYERNRVRKLLAEFPLEDGQAKQFTSLMAQAKMVMDEQIETWLAQALTVYSDGTAMFNLSSMPVSPVFFAALQRILVHMSGESHSPRGSEIENLLKILRNKSVKKTTLGGLMFEQVKPLEWLIYKEPARIKEIALKHNMLWDKRFLIHSNNSQYLPLTIRPLGKAGVAILKAERVSFPSHLTYQAKQGLLSIWQLDQLLCVPHIDYWKDVVGKQLQTSVHIDFAPAAPLHPRLQRYLP